MKLNYVETRNFRKRGYNLAVALSPCVFVFFSMVPAGSQDRPQKRITSVWTATSAEGSRVTVVSESQLNDYEAYTRGNRFYVRIPLAGLPTTMGSLLGRGFEDLQIQKAGDGILLSFRLQPATTARVEQKSNRIEIVFSIPMRSQTPTANAARTEANDSTTRDAVGSTAAPPVPDDSASRRSAKVVASPPTSPSAAAWRS
jgi:hypothetical protein